MVDFNDPVAFTAMTHAPHRASLAVPGLVPADKLYIARSGYPLSVADVRHPLTHRTNQVVFRFVIMQAVIAECFDSFFLLFIEGVVLDIGLDLFLF